MYRREINTTRRSILMLLDSSMERRKEEGTIENFDRRHNGKGRTGDVGQTFLSSLRTQIGNQLALTRLRLPLHLSLFIQR